MGHNFEHRRFREKEKSNQYAVVEGNLKRWHRKMIFDDDPMYRIEKLADDILSGASQYQVIVELRKLSEPLSDDDMEYKNFLLSVLATFEDESGYDH